MLSFLPNASANRQARKWNRRELGMRVLWGIVRPAFRLSPRLLWAWRCWLLRLFGARIGKEVRLHPTVRIIIPWTLEIGDGVGVGDGVILYALGTISIGAAATISQGAHLCAGTHDFCDPAMPLEKSPIHIGAGVWICADAFVGPGVRVGEMAVLGARAVVTRDVPTKAIMAGNPARQIGTRHMNTVSHSTSEQKS